MANNSIGNGDEPVTTVQFKGDGQCFVLIIPVGCTSCILQGIAAPAEEVPRPRRAKRQTGPILSKRQQKKAPHNRAANTSGKDKK